LEPSPELVAIAMGKAKFTYTRMQELPDQPNADASGLSFCFYSACCHTLSTLSRFQPG